MEASDKSGEWRTVVAHHDARDRPRLQIRKLPGIIPAQNVILQWDIEQDAVDIPFLDLAPEPGVSMLGGMDPGTHLIIEVLLKNRSHRILVYANIGIARGTRTTPVILGDHIAAGFFDGTMQRVILQRRSFDQDVRPMSRSLLLHCLEPVR